MKKEKKMRILMILISLLFFSCEQGYIMNPCPECDNYGEEEEPQIYEFMVNPDLYLDENGYYHFDMFENWSGISQQSIKKFSAMTNNPMQLLWWECDSYWEYEFQGQYFNVPIINNQSYTDGDGIAYIIFAPNISMEGDTVSVSVDYIDSNYDIEYYLEFYVILEWLE